MINFLRIEIDADLRCELDVSPVSISTKGRTIVVEVLNVATAMQLMKLGSPLSSYRRAAHRLKRVLDDAAMNLEVRLQKTAIFAIGHNRSTVLWRLFGLPALKLNPVMIASEHSQERAR